MLPDSACRAEGKVLRWGEETLLALRAQAAYQRGQADPFAHPLPLDDPGIDAFLRVVHLGPYLDGPCPDCSCAVGAPHHEGCDQEECATCHRQRLGCDCP